MVPASKASALGMPITSGVLVSLILVDSAAASAQLIIMLNFHKRISFNIILGSVEQLTFLYILYQFCNLTTA